MKSPGQHLVPQPMLRWHKVLFVLGLLAGLLAMHALAPGGTVHEHAGPRSTMVVEAHDHDGCAGDCGKEHLHHADPTCAAASVSGAPALPALVPDPVPVPARADTIGSYAAEAPDSARAPPSLAELQLLRI